MFKRSKDFLLTLHIPAGVNSASADYTYYKTLDESFPDGARVVKMEGPYRPLLYLAETAKYRDNLKKVFLEYQGEFSATQKPKPYIVQ
jgi:hypothetical protein